MNLFIILCCFALVSYTPLVHGQKTSLDTETNIKLYRAMKEIALQVLGTQNGGTGDDDGENNHKERYQQRLQPQISNDVPFPCNITAGRSKSVPKSVHELRPGDIDVIAAMGDSLTAGTGILAKNILGIMVENRGATALGGGQATWRKYLTIPNIIKEFNPNLIGYSANDSLTHQRASEFNVGEILAMSRDLPYMAENLIRRIKNHPNVDIEKSWKLISIFIGANDFCSDMCWTRSGPWSVLENHKNDLIRTLKILKENLPRALISLIPATNVRFLTELPDKPNICPIFTLMACSCLLGLRWLPYKEEFSEIMSAWQRIDEEVANYPEFQTEEFAVVVQPCTTNITYPMKSDGRVDWRYLSVDCFHLSQIGNARATFAIWKNMLEPVGEKSRDWDDSQTLSCPTELQPYLTTSANSRKVSKS